MGSGGVIIFLVIDGSGRVQKLAGHSGMGEDKLTRLSYSCVARW